MPTRSSLRAVALIALTLSASAAWTVSAHEPTDQPTAALVAASPATRVVDAFHAALKKGDGKAALLLLADSATIFEQGGVEKSKAEYAASHLAADMAYAAVTTDATTSRSAQALGGLAYVLTQGRTTGEFQGKPVNRVTTETVILRQLKHGWRIVHIHWSSAAAR